MIWEVKDKVLTAQPNFVTEREMEKWVHDDRKKSSPIKDKAGVFLYISANKQIPQRGENQQCVSPLFITFPTDNTDHKDRHQNMFLRGKTW